MVMPVRKTVDVFLKDKLVASYPVVVEAIDRPTDDDFIARVKKQMRRHYSSEDIKTAKFLVRSVSD
jgi:hypothetical protein